ncbi:LssY C-terminal domain-containing protein [Candidatus Peregrinibacteria bacterium]|nr:LssY C-terminal domain-containing protein [Candidatus Peregrinibacteria bacterium]MBI3816174.1 LssY C-terminal domain-containing protein [Candidatus Peregrinibacteria bacterium]
MESLITHIGALHLGGWLGYGLITLLVFGESLAFIGFAIPGSLIVIIAGGLAAQGVYDFWPLLLITSLAAIVGNTVSYELGKHGKNYLKRHPWLWKHVTKGQSFFEKHGGKSVFIGHFLGPVRHAVPVAAGVSDMRRSQFQLANISSAIIWAITHLAIGYVFGSLWKLALLWSSRAGLVLVALVLFLALIVWLWRWFLRNGEAIFELLISIGRAVATTVRQNPSVRGWVERHPKLIRFVRERFSTKSFFGLPFTILAVAFVYTVSLLLGIVQDYLESDPLIEADKRIANLLFAFRTPPLVHFFYFITLFAESGVIIAVAVLLSAALWWKRQRIFVFTLWLTLITSEGTTYLGKLLFHRLRPDELIRAVVEDSFSFPSGHATTAAAFYGFLAYLLIRTHRSWSVKVGSFFSAILAVLLIDLSRLYLGVHYLSDVLAGDLVGLTALIFAISVTEWLLWQQKEKRLSLPSSPMLVIGAMQICIVVLIFLFAPSPWTKAQTPRTERIEASAVFPLFQKGTLPFYTETLIGTHQEPINLIVVASQQCLINALSGAHWSLADTVSFHSLKQAAKAVLLNQGDSTAPMTPSFYDTRPHDLGFEKETPTQTVRARHHARFWRTRYDTGSGALFVGTVSLDTGVKWGGITHTIAPDIDTERSLIVSDLKQAGFIASEQEISLVSPTVGKNFTGDEFFTDGRAIFFTFKFCH